MKQKMNYSTLLKFRASVLLGSTALILSTCFVNCSAFTSAGGGGSADSSSQASAAGDGYKVAGVGALSVPTGDAVILRLQNGLEGKAMATAGNFAKALAQLKSNLPRETNPLKSTGFDQVQLLVYAACTDLTTGGTPLMKSVYNVDPKSKVDDARAALIAAGVRMVDQYSASLASSGPTAGAVSKAFDTLVSDPSSAESTTVAFVSVCVAANTAGSSLLGF